MAFLQATLLFALSLRTACWMNLQSSKPAEVPRRTIRFSSLTPLALSALDPPGMLSMWKVTVSSFATGDLFHTLLKLGEITVHFASDPSHPPPSAVTSDAWQRKTYILASIPQRRPKSILDDAHALISSAITTPLSFFSGATSPKATPEAVFSTDIDLAEDEVLEEERGEEAEVDDSPDWGRKVRVLGIVNKSREEKEIIEKARNRRRWQITALRKTDARTG
ncbi:hypothetical protein MSAN_02246600 [Mycena sanguinolenta]|uniref:Uncharacterized protein n=1 Tax=Mycena sanguinolenta TaxID=230812 RepID=A0A8H6XC19_9AGAR|nr:hypothetical protein MSAN_02246600 [Mycena sanguinolenta]